METADQSRAAASLRRFASFELDLRTGQLRKGGMRVKLQEQPFQVLAMLLENPGELVSREQLRQKLWPAETFVDFDHGLNTAVNKLREVLADSAASPRYIETLPKRGYRFIYPVKGSKVVGPPLSQVTTTSDNAPSASQSSATDLPRPPRAVPRLLFLALQGMYVAIYVAALAKLPRVEEIVTSWFDRAGNGVAILLLITAVLGIALRLFLLNATAFDYRGVDRLFQRLFWAIFMLDILWALSPFLLAHKIGVGLSFAAFATLVWIPFAQRTLMRMAYNTVVSD